jgi:hypothetical protein
MEKRENQRLELFHQPQIIFVDALTGPDVLHPTHQVFTTSIKLKHESIDRLFNSHAENLYLNFVDQFGDNIDVPIIKIDYSETENPNIVSVDVTGLFPINQKYRIEPITYPENPMNY